ncbi:MAG: nuclease A inhibitor family protein [Pyrinomonadaceae bacterium]
MIEKKHIFFQKDKNTSDPFLNDLTRACEGLIYISEIDSPMVPFSGFITTSIRGKDILLHVRGDAKDKVEEIAFDEFFGRLTSIKDWFGPAEIDRAKKFLDLQKLIEENLSERKVFKVGKIQLDIYAVGIDKTGQLFGVTTKAVET